MEQRAAIKHAGTRTQRITLSAKLRGGDLMDFFFDALCPIIRRNGVAGRLGNADHNGPTGTSGAAHVTVHRALRHADSLGEFPFGQAFGFKISIERHDQILATK
jgi:hypothetical protein